MFHKKARAIVQVFRPELPFAAGVCVILGEIIALGHFPSWQSLTLGFLCGFFISGSAIVFNDYFDLEVTKSMPPAVHYHREPSRHSKPCSSQASPP